MKIVESSKNYYKIILENNDKLDIYTFRNQKHKTTIECKCGRTFVDEFSPKFIDNLKEERKANKAMKKWLEKENKNK